jgi:hypothetical protein
MRSGPLALSGGEYNILAGTFQRAMTTAKGNGPGAITQGGQSARITMLQGPQQGHQGMSGFGGGRRLAIGNGDPGMGSMGSMGSMNSMGSMGSMGSMNSMGSMGSMNSMGRPMMGQMGQMGQMGSFGSNMQARQGQAMPHGLTAHREEVLNEMMEAVTACARVMSGPTKALSGASANLLSDKVGDIKQINKEIRDMQNEIESVKTYKEQMFALLV